MKGEGAIADGEPVSTPGALRPIQPPVQPPVQPRARGGVRLSVGMSSRGNALRDLRQSGSLKVVFPRSTGPDFQAVLVNTAGGVTGGDAFQLEAAAEAGSRLCLTTQTAERAYLAQPGETGRISSRISVAEGACLHWLPQETILFQGCDLHRELRVEMAAASRFLMVEPLVFGRKAMGEVLRRGRFRDRIEIYRAGRIAYLDAIDLSGDIAAHLAHAQTGQGAGAMASLVYIAPDAEAQLSFIRRTLGDYGGASMIGPDILVLRLLASDSYRMRKVLIPVLNRLSDDNLPRCWMT